MVVYSFCATEIYIMMERYVKVALCHFIGYYDEEDAI